MDCTVHGVAKSRTRLSDFHFLPWKWNNTILQDWEQGDSIHCPLTGTWPSV